MAEFHDLERRTAEARRKALVERLPFSMAIGSLAALGLICVLWDKVPHAQLLIWWAIRMAVSMVRAVQARMLLRTDIAGLPRHIQIYRMMAFMDGGAWGALGWWITPVYNMDVAVITISVLIGVSALGVFILHMDLWSAALFITPMLLPNALHATTRPDSMGCFGGFAVSVLFIMLMMEARRSNLRVHELFRLRFQSEQLAHARAEALRQAEHLSEAKSRFVATMSHEMRTPLHGILGLARWLSEEERHPDKAHRLALIRSSGEHLVSVINDVLDFSRMESSGLPIHKQAFDLHALVHEVADTLRIGAAEKRLSVVVHFDAETDTDVMGDAVRIRQVLNNLIGNAIKFTREGGIRLRVHRVPQTDDVSIAVQDTGIGIPADEVEKVFEAFHQAEGTYQRRFGGTGLGLTISKELCRAMGGDLTCRSEVGKGSEFRFVLPLPTVPRVAPALDAALAASGASSMAAHARSAEAPAVPAASNSSDAEAHVLLVEDNPVNVLVAQAQLERLGVKVSVVHDGLQAVDWLQQQRPDLVLMDCEMPGLDGFEATLRIREHERAVGREPVNIVALTANGREFHGDRCRSVGMNGHLAKPFKPEDLARVLVRHLRGGFKLTGRAAVMMQSSGA